MMGEKRGMDVKKKRETMGLNQQDFAVLCKCSLMTIYRVEKTPKKIISNKLRKRIWGFG